MLERAHSVIKHPGTVSLRSIIRGACHAPKHQYAPGSAPPSWLPTYYCNTRTCELLRQSNLLKNTMDLHLRRQLAIMISHCIHLRCMRLPRTNHLKVFMVIRVQHERCDSQRHCIAHKLVDAIPRFLTPVLENLTQSSSDGRQRSSISADLVSVYNTDVEECNKFIELH